MIVAAALIVVAVVVAAGFTVTRAQAPRVLESRMRRQWVVTLKSGAAFRGVLTDHDRTCLVLSDAEALSDEQTRTPLDGEIVVMLADVKYAQRL